MAIRFITVNNKKYRAREFDFNLVCDLEENGIELANCKNKKFALVRAYVSLCIGDDKEVCGQEIEAHLSNGGNFNEVIEIIGEKMEESDFFRILTKTEEEEVTESAPKKTKQATNR